MTSNGSTNDHRSPVQDQIRVLICEDLHSVRQSYADRLELQPDITVVGQASDGQQAVEIATELAPDVVLMDLALPKLSGAKATSAIKEQLPNTKVVALTGYADEQTSREALNAGASGYLLKGDTAEDIEHAIRKAALGESPINPRVNRQLLSQLHPSAHSPSLTDREIEFVSALADYDTNRDIAEALRYSESKVRDTFQAACLKLGVSSRNRLLAEAIRQGVVDIRS